MKTEPNKTAAENLILALFGEYCDEAEHQDGDGVWTNLYGSPQDIVDDFLLYATNLEETDDV